MALTKIKLDVLFLPKITELTSQVILDSQEEAIFECTFDANPVVYDGIHRLRQGKESEEEVELSADSKHVSISWNDMGGNTVKSRLVLKNMTRN